MRKCSYWFSLLSEKEQKEYKENAKSQFDFIMEHAEEDFAGFIGGGFIWEGTPQGHKYWSKISQRTNHNHGNFLTRLLRGIGLRA
jgi:hypothetical protein